MINKVVLIRHDDGPLDDRVSKWLAIKGFELIVCKPFKGETLPALGEDIAATIIFGGKNIVHETDKFPFLRHEYRWIDACIKADIPMLGLCQGAQQIALHLGA